MYILLAYVVCFWCWKDGRRYDVMTRKLCETARDMSLLLA
jgi:hypothetical protein